MESENETNLKDQDNPGMKKKKKYVEMFNVNIVQVCCCYCCYSVITAANINIKYDTNIMEINDK